MALTDDQRAQLLTDMRLVGPAASAQLTDAISEAPKLERTIDGATTLTLRVADHRRSLRGSKILTARSWMSVDGMNLELVAHSKSGDYIDLTFEDAIVGALRRRDGPRSWPADSTTRAQILRDLAAEAQVPIHVDPAKRGNVQDAVSRSVDPDHPEKVVDKTDSWKLSGSLTSDVAWRRFSTGTAVVAGSDAYLMTRYAPLTLREHVGPVQDIDFDVDYRQKSSTATIGIDSSRWATPPGQAVELPDMGPASGRWLISKVTKTVTRLRGELELVRATEALAEPEGEDTGEFDFLPVAAGGATAGASTPTPVSPRAADGSPRAQMMAYALRQRGKPYVWGSSGPAGYDCSGLVQESTRAGGRVLGKGSKAQYATCKAAGKLISVDTALATYGAILFRMSGDPTHVAFSMGDGTTMEARGKAYGCDVFPGAAKRNWTAAALWL